jgi:hypothetical protein
MIIFKKLKGIIMKNTIFLLGSLYSSMMAMHNLSSSEERPVISDPKPIQKSFSGYVEQYSGKLDESTNYIVLKGANIDKNDVIVRVVNKDGAKEYKALSVNKNGRKTDIVTTVGVFSISGFFGKSPRFNNRKIKTPKSLLE